VFFSSIFVTASLGAVAGAPLTVIDLRLPSISTGIANGTLAVRLFTPVSADDRFNDGAPVVVACQGGTAAGDLKNPFPPALDDVIIVSFLYPGGRQGGLRSDGFMTTGASVASRRSAM